MSKECIKNKYSCRFPYQWAKTYNTNTAKTSLIRSVILALLAGFILRVGMLYQNYPLWLDEAYIAHNLFSLSFTELTGALKYGQSCPMGVLWAMKITSYVLPTELGFRLIPFLSGLALLVLTPVVVWKATKSSRIAATATWLTALSPPLIFYTAQTKQYEIEALVALLVLFTASRASQPKKTYILLYPLLVLFSFSAPLLIAAEIISRFKLNIKKWAYGLPSFLAFCVVFVIQIRHFLGKQELVEFWQYGFPQPNDNLLVWTAMKFSELAGFVTGVNYPLFIFGILGAIAISGIILLQGKLRTFALLVFCLAVLGAWLKLYPLEGRLSLYLFPLIILSMSVAIGKMKPLTNICLLIIILMPMLTTAASWALIHNSTHYVFKNTALPFQDIRSPMQDLISIKARKVNVHRSAMPQAIVYKYILQADLELETLDETSTGWAISAVPIQGLEPIRSYGDSSLFFIAESQEHPSRVRSN